MTERCLKTALSALLHNIGKATRGDDGKPLSSCDYLKDRLHLSDSEILNAVCYHYEDAIANAPIGDNDISYIIHTANSIVSASDGSDSRHEFSNCDNALLDSVFNILNGNNGHSHYPRKVMKPKGRAYYPTDNPMPVDTNFYKDVDFELSECVKDFTFSRAYVDYLISVLEMTLSYVPAATSENVTRDISLFDHLKMTAAVACCIEQYVGADNNLKQKLLVNERGFYSEKAFLLYSMDFSGIQNFIYRISSKGALKALRSRSFYLDIMMEHIVDELLDKVSLSRANLIYSGGGHCYLLLPDTDLVKETLGTFDRDINEWLLDKFHISLFVGCGYAECSADDLANGLLLNQTPNGNYKKLYSEITSKISSRKSARYTAKAVRKLNSAGIPDGRECVVCHNVGHLNSNNKCEICSAIENMSSSIIRDRFYMVLKEERTSALPLPFGCCLIGGNEADAIKHSEDSAYLRCYTKNIVYACSGKFTATKLWIADYTDTSYGFFDEMAAESVGIERLGVLRADVDNLGTAIANGFDEQYATLSRSAALSRQLSLFFKSEINQILSNSDFISISSKNGPRNVVIVYSGGDDLFLIGSWNDCIESFVDIRNKFKEFSLGTLTISGGISLYQSGFPSHIMASDTAKLEEYSKSLPDKDGITLFDTSGSYKWDCFLKGVIEDKYKTISRFFKASYEIPGSDYGKVFLYRLLELIRNSGERINRARFIYLLSRMEPSKDASDEIKHEYKIFADRMYHWYEDFEDRRQMVTAIYLYVYTVREKAKQTEGE